jgi:hypothetical protein
MSEFLRPLSAKEPQKPFVKPLLLLLLIKLLLKPLFRLLFETIFSLINPMIGSFGDEFLFGTFLPLLKRIVFESLIVYKFINN